MTLSSAVSRWLAAGLFAVVAMPAFAFEFASIDGGVLDTDDWKGRPVLVVNTASLCAFTPQYEGLQALHDTYADQGLVVLAVPSDDFRQELADENAVKDFCEVNFSLTLPMSEITHVKGRAAHPFYKWLADAHGFTPRWNFNKVLPAPDGTLAATFGSGTRPDAAPITSRIEALLPE